MSSDWPAAIRAVLFDFDGTLTAPGTIDFPKIKKALGCSPRVPILEFIDGLATDGERRRAFDLLDRFEMEAAVISTPNRSAEDLIRYLRSRSVALGIISRNRLPSILRALENFTTTRAGDFEVIVSRDDAKPKPDEQGILLAARELDVRPGELALVGDYVFDIEAARRAGCRSVFLTNGAVSYDLPQPPDHVIADLAELKDVLEPLLPLAGGKLPNRFLKAFLAENPLEDPSVLVPPGIGQDTAAVDLRDSERVVVLKSDPITFAVDRLGYSAVAINVNDVATSGAVPRWLLTTLLLPVGTTATQVRCLIEELQEASRALGLTVCGGHTEITDAVSRPVVVGQLVGTVSRDRLIDKRAMRGGDHILITKGVAVEGTSILARDFPGELRTAGVPESIIASSRRLLFDPGISVLTEARIAAETRAVTALHDVTEGGVVTALDELSAAGGHHLRVDVDRIPILPETRTICAHLDLDPLGLIGSGSLLIACAGEASEELKKALRAAGVRTSRIGEVLGEGVGIEATRGDGAASAGWPHFETDEIVRAIERLQAARSGDRVPSERTPSRGLNDE